MSERYRVATGARSFDLERFKGYDKDGAEVWAKEAYFRNRADLLASLSRRRLSAALARDVPSYHQDSLDALVDFSKRRVLSADQIEKMRVGRRSTSQDSR